MPVYGLFPTGEGPAARFCDRRNHFAAVVWVLGSSNKASLLECAERSPDRLRCDGLDLGKRSRGQRPEPVQTGQH